MDKLPYNLCHSTSITSLKTNYGRYIKFWKVCHDQRREEGGQKPPYVYCTALVTFQLVKDQANLWVATQNP
jgi:hypothetical protein